MGYRKNIQIHKANESCKNSGCVSHFDFTDPVAGDYYNKTGIFLNLAKRSNRIRYFFWKLRMIDKNFN